MTPEVAKMRLAVLVAAIPGLAADQSTKRYRDHSAVVSPAITGYKPRSDGSNR